MVRYTARLKKRNDRKRQRGKKGSVFEEEYLINSLRKLIVRVDATKCKSLLYSMFALFKIYFPVLSTWEIGCIFVNELDVC